jgi:hypothetical protein
MQNNIKQTIKEKKMLILLNNKMFLNISFYTYAGSENITTQKNCDAFVETTLYDRDGEGVFDPEEYHFKMSEYQKGDGYIDFDSMIKKVIISYQEAVEKWNGEKLNDSYQVLLCENADGWDCDFVWDIIEAIFPDQNTEEAKERLNDIVLRLDEKKNKYIIDCIKAGKYLEPSYDDYE